MDFVVFGVATQTSNTDKWNELHRRWLSGSIISKLDKVNNFNFKLYHIIFDHPHCTV